MVKFIVLLIVLVLFFFSSLIIHPGQMLYTEDSDILHVFSFWSFLRYKSLQLPLWSSYRFSGEPCVGNPQSLAYYPPSLSSFFFKPESLMVPLFILHLILAGLFMFFYLRRKVGDSASFIGAICYIFSLKIIGHIYAGHINFIVSFAYLPLLFYLLEKILEQKSLFYSIIMGAVLSLQLLGGHSQVALYIFFVLSLYFLFNLILMLIREKDKWKAMQWCFFFVFAFVVCLGLSAVLLLPASELTKFALRSKPRWSFISYGSLGFKNLISLALPNFWGHPSAYHPSVYKGAILNFHEACVYVGVMPFILAICGILFKMRKKAVGFFLFLAVFTFLFALGKNGPLLYLFYRYVPKFNLFRIPTRMIFIFIFAISVLVAFGSDFLSREITQATKRKLKIFFSLFFLLSMGASFLLGKMVSAQAFFLKNVPFLYRSPAFGFMFFVFLLCLANVIIFLRMQDRLKGGFLKFTLAGIIFLDLGMYGLPLIQTDQSSKIFAKTETVKILEKDKTRFRVWDLANQVPQYIAVRYNIEKIGGESEPLILKNYVEFSNCLLSPSGANLLPGDLPISRIELRETLFFNIIDLLNVKYIISKKRIDVPNLRLIHKGENLYIFENLNVLPRAFVVRKAIVIPGIKATWRELKRFNPREHVILDRDFPFLDNPGEFKEAEITYYSPNRIDLFVDLFSPGFLVLSENWYPGWKAYDNGREKDILKVDYTLRGLYLEKGKHEVSFIFCPRSYLSGRMISLATLIFAGGYFSISYLKRCRKV